MPDLFDHAMQARLNAEAPLADRLFSSIILWGPPGTGKNTLAMVIANQTRSHFETLPAVLKDGIEKALQRPPLPEKDPPFRKRMSENHSLTRILRICPEDDIRKAK